MDYAYGFGLVGDGKQDETSALEHALAAGDGVTLFDNREWK